MVTLLLHRQEASAARWSKNDHETGRADVRQVKKQLAARPKTAPHPWCDVKPFFLYNIHFTIFHSHGTQVPDGHALLSHHR